MVMAVLIPEFGPENVPSVPSRLGQALWQAGQVSKDYGPKGQYSASNRQLEIPKEKLGGGSQFPLWGSSTEDR
jgi:hypothetical protein